MRKVLTILMLALTLTIAGALTASAQQVRQLKVYLKGGIIDKVRVSANSPIRHSCIDLNGEEQEDYVTMVVTDAEGNERPYLISQVDSLVLPNGQRVVFQGSMLSQPVYCKHAEGWKEQSRRAPRRTSFNGTFPGTSGTGNVTFYWTENDHIRLDVGDESRASNLTNGKTSASFDFEDLDTEATSYMVYYPDKSVTIPTVQTQTGANNSEHIGRSGDCGTAVATISDNDNENVNYSFTLQHKAAYLCFLPHIDNLPSAKLTKITLSCSASIAGTYQLSGSGLYNGSNMSSQITLNLVPQTEYDFFIGHDVEHEQDTCAAYMVIAPQGENRTFTATYYITDTLSRIEKIYRQTFSFQPKANTVYPVTCHILDEEFRVVDMGLSCNWSNVNVAAAEPSRSGTTFASDTEANQALLEQTVVTQWLMPTEDQREEILDKCQWVRSTYNGAAGYLVTGAAPSLGDGITHRIFIPCAEGRTPAECLQDNFRPVEALMIDLGLTSGTKWASRNIGANSVEDYGEYFAWGETETKDSYTSGTYKYGTQNLGNNFDISGTQNDAAVVNWGGLWRMPTKNEMLELRDNCTWTWSSINGVNGYIITGESGNKIFLPAAGVMDGTSQIKPGEGGSYFSSTLGGDRSSNVWTLYWQINRSANICVLASEYDYWLFESHERPYKRYYGATLRPVASPNAIAKDGNSYHIVTDSANWKLRDTEAILYGTLSSLLPIKGTVRVGFVVGDSAQIVKGKSRFEFSKETTVAGSFSQSLPVHDNIGYWYRAYVQTADSVFYGEARHYAFDYVDLGLTSGTLWANMNVGANQPSEYGNYYAWGETEPKNSYTSSTYKYGTLNIGEDFDIAGTEYDAVYVNMGGAWRMPTRSQLEELLNQCNWTWTTLDGNNGYQVTSKVNGKSIFLPAAGMMDGTSQIKPVNGGCYFSSTLSGDRSNNVWTLYWQIDRNSNIHVLASEYDYWLFESHERPYKRYYGSTIRAVFMPNAVTDANIMNIRTDSATWKLNDTSAELYGTIGSTLPLAEGTKVGFVVGNSSSVNMSSAVSVLTQTKTTTGSYHATVSNITDNLGYWYRAYVETPTGDVYYGDAMHFGWEMVDLGLPSGTLWANVNVGGAKPEDTGDYYAWGEVEPKDSYTSSTYLYGTQNLSDDLNIAATQYDAAYVNMNSSWCMPTRDQQQELLDNCTAKWTGHDGMNGFVLTSKINGRSIFLPAAGMKDGTSLIKPVAGGCYFSSTLGGNNSNNVWTLYWQIDRNSNIHVLASEYDYWLFESHERPYKRYYGSTIRAVARRDATVVGGAEVRVSTSPATWTEGDATATIKGTLTADQTLTSGVTVGFLVADHHNSTKATSKTYHDIVVSQTGEFTMQVPVATDDGVYYTAYIKNGGRYFYGKTLFVGKREMVDLGLASGTMWANMNVGADKPTDVGKYYAWGETTWKEVYSEDTYTYRDGDGAYLDLGSDIAGTVYDAATANWGSNWQIPSLTQIQELISSCTWSNVTENGQPCYKATSNVNGNSILIPEGGARNGTSVNIGSNWAFYWTSTNDGINTAHRTNFYCGSGIGTYPDAKWLGLTIRPVRK